MKNVLVTGGAGYIGSHTVKALIERGDKVVVFDNLEYGHREAVPREVELVVGDLRNPEEIGKALKEGGFDGIIHFAAYAQAGESVQKPDKYFHNNVYGTLNLLQALHAHGVNSLVFSSTCAIYGQPEQVPIVEEESKKPESPYGESKLMVEQMLKWFDRSLDLRYVALRYFNAAGAALDGSLGEDHDPETHLIPIALQAALGKREGLTIFGDDYPTDDGTNVRDYIHVLDLAEAHLNALDYLIAGGESDWFNLGTGQGYSVKQVIEVVKAVTNRDFPVTIGPRRPGDPARLFADNRKVFGRFGWEPWYSVETIVKTAWEWYQRHPEGYKN